MQIASVKVQYLSSPTDIAYTPRKSSNGIGVRPASKWKHKQKAPPQLDKGDDRRPADGGTDRLADRRTHGQTDRRTFGSVHELMA